MDLSFAASSSANVSGSNLHSVAAAKTLTGDQFRQHSQDHAQPGLIVLAHVLPP